MSVRLPGQFSRRSRVLTILKRSPGQTFPTIADILGGSRRAVSTLVDKLVVEGLIERRPITDIRSIHYKQDGLYLR